MFRYSTISPWCVLHSLLLLIATAHAQPYRGPFVVSSTIGGSSFSQIAVCGWGERADILVIDSASAFNMIGRQLSVNVNDGSSLSGPNELAIADASQYRLAGIVSDSSRWASMVYEAENLADNAGTNRVLLFSDNGNGVQTDTLQSGFWPGESPPPTPTDEFGSHHSLQRRRFGGFVTGWIRHSVDETGGEDNSVVLRLFDNNFQQDIEYVTRSVNLPFGPRGMYFVSLNLNWAGAIYNDYVDNTLNYYVRVISDSMYPSELTVECGDGFNPIIPLWLGLNNGNQPLFLIAPTFEYFPMLLVLDPNGHCGAAEFPVDYDTFFVAFHRDFGTALAVTYGPQLHLWRMDNLGYFVPGPFVFWQNEFDEVVSAAISITDEGLVIVTWSVRDYGSAVADTVMIASIGFYDPLLVKSLALDQVPASYALTSYPNPFNSATTLSFALPVTGLVEIKLFDVLGRAVRTILNEVRQAGEHRMVVNAGELPSGIYVARLQANDIVVAHKLLLLK